MPLPHTAIRRQVPPPAATPTPGHAAWHRGVELARAGRLDEAAESLRTATRLAPRESLYWLNLASVRRRQGRLDDALDHAEHAFGLDRRNRLACHLAADLLRGQQRHARALELLEALDPEVERDVTHLTLQASQETTLGRSQAAAQTCLKLLAIQPDHIEGHQQLGFALANLQQYAEASECFRTASLLEPQLGSAIYSAHYSAWACDWAAVAADGPRLAEALARVHESARPGFSPFCLLSLSDDAAAHRTAAAVAVGHMAREARRAWVEAGRGPVPTVADGHPEAAASPKLRVGFVSADFRLHATSVLLVRTLERLDRARFEVVLYAHGRSDDSTMRRRLVAGVDRFVDCAEMSVVEQAALIRADGIGILIDMSGFTAQTRLGVFALRPAPVQALWLAYPSTTGSDFIDYLIGDPVLTPLEHAGDFSEQIAQLPVCYEPTDELREHPEPSTRAEAGLPEDAFVYACFNQSYKITGEVFGRWCRILERVPNSVLWLLVPEAPIQATLRRHAEAHGIAAGRLVFAPFVAPTEHLARLALADLFLDTFPYGAHTTCSDALWMGLPVLTQIGRSFSARVAASLVAAVGVPELAVATAEEYEHMAVVLAEDAGVLQQLRRHLADGRLQLPLFDNLRFTRELEDLFERMAARWRAGEPPAALPAAAPRERLAPDGAVPAAPPVRGASAPAEPDVRDARPGASAPATPNEAVASPAPGAAPATAATAAPAAPAAGQSPAERAAASNHAHWAACRDTHVAVGSYYRRVAAWLPVLCERYLGPDDRVLDAGCGDGEYTQLIAARCAHVEAFDLSPALLERARGRSAPNVDYRLGDIAAFAGQGAAPRFDAAFVMGVFVTIHGERFEHVVAELAARVRPGGLLVTRDSVTAARDVVRHVTGGYTAHYRAEAHLVGAIEAAGFALERSLYLETFDDLVNSFYVFRRC